MVQSVTSHNIFRDGAHLAGNYTCFHFFQAHYLLLDTSIQKRPVFVRIIFYQITAEFMRE